MDTMKNALQVQMYAHYRNWEASGESQISYCKSQGLSFAKFNYWVRKLRTGGQSPSGEPSGFIALEVAAGNTPILEIMHSSGHRISIYRNVEAGFIKELLG